MQIKYFETICVKDSLSGAGYCFPLPLVKNKKIVMQKISISLINNTLISIQRMAQWLYKCGEKGLYTDRFCMKF